MGTQSKASRKARRAGRREGRRSQGGRGLCAQLESRAGRAKRASVSPRSQAPAPGSQRLQSRSGTPRRQVHCCASPCKGTEPRTGRDWSPGQLCAQAASVSHGVRRCACAVRWLPQPSYSGLQGLVPPKRGPEH
ncbi:hypothetical protein HispidOSU_000098 [Sigmodon hispidus]